MKYIIALILILMIIGAVVGKMGAEKPPATTTIAEDTREITKLFREQGQSFKRIRNGLDDLYHGLEIEWNQGAIDAEYQTIDFANDKISYIEHDLNDMTEERRVYLRKLLNKEPKSRQQEYDDIAAEKVKIEVAKQNIVKLKAEGIRIRENPTRNDTMYELDNELEAYDRDMEASEVVIEDKLERLTELDRQRKLLK